MAIERLPKKLIKKNLKMLSMHTGSNNWLEWDQKSIGVYIEVLDMSEESVFSLILIAQSCPLVVLGHSLGGIIIKAAFVKASQEKQYSHHTQPYRVL
jgi:hypothetical protein